MSTVRVEVAPTLTVVCWVLLVVLLAATVDELFYRMPHVAEETNTARQVLGADDRVRPVVPTAPAVVQPAVRSESVRQIGYVLLDLHDPRGLEPLPACTATRPTYTVARRRPH